jgi:hypothetical protein
VDATSLQRLLACGCILLPLYLDSTNDLGRRYTACLTEPFVDGSNPQLKDWMPGPGGIFYADNMQFFYNTFYKNPQGDWRYIVGFEPALMPPDDLKIYRDIHSPKEAPSPINRGSRRCARRTVWPWRARPTRPSGPGMEARRPGRLDWAPAGQARARRPKINV